LVLPSLFHSIGNKWEEGKMARSLQSLHKLALMS
jgi:hypothetical protein